MHIYRYIYITVIEKIPGNINLVKAYIIDDLPSILFKSPLPLSSKLILNIVKWEFYICNML